MVAEGIAPAFVVGHRLQPHYAVIHLIGQVHLPGGGIPDFCRGPAILFAAGGRGPVIDFVAVDIFLVPQIAAVFRITKTQLAAVFEGDEVSGACGFQRHALAFFIDPFGGAALFLFEIVLGAVSVDIQIVIALVQQRRVGNLHQTLLKVQHKAIACAGAFAVCGVIMPVLIFGRVVYQVQIHRQPFAVQMEQVFDQHHVAGVVVDIARPSW